MSTFEKGDMWSIWGKTTLFVFTANSTIKANGELVMGAGIAKQVRDRIPGSSKVFGNRLSRFLDNSGVFGRRYYFLTQRLYTESSGSQLVGAFQVKNHFSENASLLLIQVSLVKLFEWIVVHLDKSPTGMRIDMNYPGIGNGRLTKAEVEPYLNLLPDFVHIWEYEQPRQKTFFDL